MRRADSISSKRVSERPTKSAKGTGKLSSAIESAKRFISSRKGKTEKKPRGMASAINAAGDYIDDKTRLSFLLKEAKKKAAENKNALKDAWKSLDVFLRLLKAWKRGEYKDASIKAVIMAIAAVIYLVNPFDAIPDFLGIIGFSDDAALILYVFRLMGAEMDKFLEWEKNKSSKPKGVEKP